MPVENDLTPEERAEFARMGAADLGEGGEPVNDGTQQPVVLDDNGESQQHADRRPNGQFASREEREAAARQDNQQPPAEGQPVPPANAEEGQQQGQQPNQQQQPQMVPHAALHAERQRAAEAMRQNALLTQRMNALLNAQQQQQQTTMPDINTDPAGYIQALETRLARFEQAQQENTQYRQIDMGIEQDEQAYSVQVPDYEQASDYYVQSRARELLQFNTPEDAQRILQDEARAIATQSWQRGMSAAAAVYNLAMARGYNPNAPSNVQNKVRQQVDNFQQNGQQPQTQRGPSPQAVIDSVNQGQQQSRSLSGGGAGGGGNAGALNAQALLDMSDEEFERHLALGSKGANARFAAVG
jgi:hypothetical protein